MKVRINVLLEFQKDSSTKDFKTEIKRLMTPGFGDAHDFHVMRATKAADGLPGLTQCKV